MNTPTQDPREGWTSASNAMADSLCPGRHLAQKSIPEQPDDSKSKDAEAGTLFHEALLKRDPSKLPVDMRERYDQVCTLEDKAVADFFGPYSEQARKNVFRERRFWTVVAPPGGGPQLRHSGQPDVVYRNGTKALIIEYKSLYGDVPPAPQNMQLRDQACLVRINFVVVNEVGVLPLQPALIQNPEPPCVYNGDQLRVAEQQMCARVHASNTPGAPRVAGEVQCKHCRAKLECNQYHQWAGQLVPGMVSLLEVSPVNWTPAQRSLFLEKKSLAKKWLEDCEDAIKAILAKDPDGAPGFRLKPGSIRESITDAQTCFARFSALGGSVEGFMPCVNVTKAKLKEAVAVVTGARGKGLQSAMDKVLEGITVRSQSAPSITRNTGADPTAEKELNQ